jgi:hypothetical protein
MAEGPSSETLEEKADLYNFMEWDINLDHPRFIVASVVSHKTIKIRISRSADFFPS